MNTILAVPTFCFLVPPYDTANKIAGAKLTKENTIAPWAPRSLDNVLFSARAQSSGTGTWSEQGLLSCESDINFSPCTCLDPYSVK